MIVLVPVALVAAAAAWLPWLTGCSAEDYNFDNPYFSEWPVDTFRLSPPTPAPPPTPAVWPACEDAKTAGAR